MIQVEEDNTESSLSILNIEGESWLLKQLKEPPASRISINPYSEMKSEKSLMAEINQVASTLSFHSGSN
jgi:hypothetical protein